MPTRSEIDGEKWDFPFLGFLVLLVWAPLPFGSNRPWAVSILEFWSFLIATVWLWGFSRKKYESTAAFKAAKPVFFVMIIWLVYGAIQFVPLPANFVKMLSPTSAEMHMLSGPSEWMTISVDPYASLTSWFKCLAYVVLFGISLLVIENSRRLKLVAYTLVLSGLVQAFYGSFMTLSGIEYGFFVKKYAYLGNATGTFVNRNHLAGYLELCIASGIGLMISMLGDSRAVTTRQKLRNLLGAILGEKFRVRLFLAVMVIALVLTHSRMGNTAFFSSMLVAGGLALILMKQAPRSMVVLLVSLMLIDIFIVGTWFGVEKVVNRIESTSMAHDSGRVDVNEVSLKILKDYEITGSGGGSFYTVFPRYRTADIAAYYDHAHNDYMEFAVEYGIAAVLPGMMVLFSLAAALLAVNRRRNGLMRGMAFSSMMGIFALMIHSSVDFNLQIPANALTFMVILSLGWVSLYLERGPAYDRD